MEAKPQDVFNVMESEAMSLAAFLEKLPSERWGDPSACEGWLVGDVIAHLASGSTSYISRIKRSLGQEVSFTPYKEGAMRSSVAEEARRLCEEAGELLVDNFKRSNVELSSFLRGLTPEQLCVESRLAGGKVEAWFYGVLRITELSIHGWDIRSPFDADLRITDAALSSFVDVHFPTFIARAIRPEAHELRNGLFRFELSSPARSVVIRLDDGVPSMGPETAARPDATLATAVEDFTMLMYGRFSYDTLVGEGRLLITGDRELADSFGTLCRGV